MTTITGVVRDRKNQEPIAQVLVTLMSSQGSGERAVMTDGVGSYTIPDVPAGAFTLRFENGGFRTIARGGIAPGGTEMLRFDVEMEPVPFRAGVERGA